jgi:NAD(P)H dehydrogenase (quinone)
MTEPANVPNTGRRKLPALTGLRTLASSDTSNRTWSTTGPDLVTYPELAKLASELTGRTVEYVAVTPEERIAQLIAAGTPELIAKIMVSSQVAIS